MTELEKSQAKTIELQRQQIELLRDEIRLLKEKVDYILRQLYGARAKNSTPPNSNSCLTPKRQKSPTPPTAKRQKQKMNRRLKTSSPSQTASRVKTTVAHVYQTTFPPPRKPSSQLK
jgi:hypothetical protein